MEKGITKSARFIFMIVILSLSLYLSYFKQFTTYAYIFTIGIAWIIIIQKIDKELTALEKTIASLMILFECAISILGNFGLFGIIGKLIGAPAIIFTELIFYALITGIKDINIPNLLRVIIFIVISIALGIFVNYFGERLLDLTQVFFASGVNNELNITTFIPQQYSLTVFLYNLIYSLPIYLTAFVLSYAVKNESQGIRNLADLRIVVIIIILPIILFTYMNIISDTAINEGEKYIAALSSYDSFNSKNQFKEVFENQVIGLNKIDEKDDLSYYNNNYFYESPYSIEAVIYNYQQIVKPFISNTRISKKEMIQLKDTTANYLTYIDYADKCCKSNIIYMWVLYLINCLVILCSYLIYRADDKTMRVKVITRNKNLA